jgi:hypothetical protein
MQRISQDPIDYLAMMNQIHFMDISKLAASFTKQVLAKLSKLQFMVGQWLSTYGTQKNICFLLFCPALIF